MSNQVPTWIKFQVQVAFTGQIAKNTVSSKKKHKINNLWKLVKKSEMRKFLQLYRCYKWKRNAELKQRDRRYFGHDINQEWGM